MIKLNHIAIAISNLPKVEKLLSVLGLQIDHSEKVSEQGVMTHFVALPEEETLPPTAIELLESIDPEGPISRFLTKKGPGIHHLSFQVGAGELKSISEKLRKNEFQLIYPQPKKGAHGMLINFIHPSSCDGVLIELMEKTE